MAFTLGNIEAQWELDEQTEDRGSLHIIKEKDGKTVTIKARSPGSEHESAVTLPLEIWQSMVSG